MENGPQQSLPTLGYRLAARVSIRERSGSIVLILSYPLKTMTLHSAWRVVVSRLKGKDFISLDEIRALMGDMDMDRVESMLTTLAVKGFLEQKGVSKLEEYPKVSVVIPVYNRPTEIKECLQSLLHLDYPVKQLEIVVVDDGSTDHTPIVVSEFPVRLIRMEKNRQAPFCRNTGAEAAEGEILAFVDSDCLVDPQWLKELLPTFKDASIGAVGGRVDAHYRRSGLDRYEAVNSSLIMGRRAMVSQRKENVFYVPSCNLLVQKKVFQHVGGFREELVVGEDVDLCWRIQDFGFRIAFQPVGSVLHKHRNRLIPFCKRRFEYGTSEPLLQKLHKKRRKKWIYPLGGWLFLILGILAVTMNLPFLFLLCGGIILWDALLRWRTIRTKELPLGFLSIFLAVVRSYSAYGYHLCAFTSRYYLIWAIFLVFLLPTASMMILVMHLLVGLVDFIVKKPQLNPFQFLFYFTLDQISYQCGVWRACLKERSFGSVNPKLALSASSNTG